MIRFYKPTFDASIYEFDRNRNTGLDEILELRYLTGMTSRALIKFDVNNINDADEHWLRLYTSAMSEIPLEYEIEAIPLVQHWDMGMGHSIDEPRTTGSVTWLNATTDDVWDISGSAALSGSYDYYSYAGGGIWDESYAVSQSFNFTGTDIDINVSSIINAWKNNDIDNYGLILKVKDETIDFGDMSFYSFDTHTVFQPRLVSYTSSSFFKPGDLTPITNYKDGNVISFNNLKSRYKKDTTARIRFTGRELYPVKTYNLISDYLVKHNFPVTTYYSIKDAHTDDTIIEYSDVYTNVLCDNTSNYFDLNFVDWDPERYYRILIKVEWYDGTIETFDNDFTFKLIR